MFLSRDAVELHTVCFGSGSRTLVAHGGWTGSWALWEQPFELLSPSWRCIGFDHRGSGESTVDPDAITLDAMVADLMAVLDAHDVSRCVLAAESMGGIVAVHAAAREPDRFEALVLISAPLTITQGSAGRLATGARIDYPATVAAFVDACLPEDESGHLRAWGRALLGRADAECAARLLEACYDLRPDLGALTMPTAVIRGSRDVIVPAADAAALVAGLPDATFHPLDGIGHVPTVTAPADVARIIDPLP